MKYKCEVIKDLLPLYIDGLVSEESKKMVAEHLKECAKCREYYEDLKSEEFIDDIKKDNTEDNESKNIMKSIKSKIRRRNFIIGIISALSVIILLFSIFTYMKNTTIPIKFDDNIRVELKDGNVYAVLKNNTYINAKSKIKEVTNQYGEKEVILYFYFSTTLWEKSFNFSSDYTSEYILVPNGKEVADKIYYYIGDYEKIEEIDNLEAELLWEK